MTRTRRFGTVIASVIASVLGVLTTATGAFAMPVAPPAGDNGQLVSVPTHITGLATWQVVLIAGAAASIAAIAAAVTVRTRTRAHLRPAA